MEAKNYKVVTAEEMARIEKRAIESGCFEERFIEEAGRKVGTRALEWIEKRGLNRKATLLVGKGNNGADAYAAGVYLLKKGIPVHALFIYDEPAPQNQEWKHRFLSCKGTAEKFSAASSFDALILDGLLGTGFRGPLDPLLVSPIERANDSRKPILAIDIPSGLNGNTGSISSVAIHASKTIALGLPKLGFFLRDGWNVVGQLQVEEFGLPERFVEEAIPSAYLLNEKTLKLPRLVRNRHKYQAGYVVGLSGSERFKGAPKLAGLSALRSGAGIVRVFHLGEIGLGPMELILEPWDLKSWGIEVKRASALFLGPGLGDKIPPIDLRSIEIPSVIDADLLQPNIDFPKSAIVTPHRGEMGRLLQLEKKVEEEEFLSLCQNWAKERGVTLILKGAPTFVFQGKDVPVIIARGDPGMATAGTGDVLTGIVAALLAQKMSAHESAILGVYLHAAAGEIAAQEKSSYGVIATDLIDSLPQVLNQLMKRGIPSSIETAGR